jgi:predicted CXXCH cytochrome family protein
MPYGKKRMTFSTFTQFTWFARFTQFVGLTLFTRFSRFAVLRSSEPGKLGKLGRLSKLVFLLCVLGAVLFAGVVEAKMKGRCKDCHAMHASTPFPVLTKGGCVGCHGQVPDGTENIIRIGKARIPQILHHMADGDFASGNFYYVADGYNPDYSKGHNVAGISHQESIPTMNVPPGFIGNVVIPGGKGPEYWPNEQVLTCSGTWGCHGDRTIEDPYLSLYRAHHTHNGEIDGSTIGKSYRFLYGITGVEHPDWEYLATKDDHNGYKGDFNHNTIDTISYLCGECHGKFHPNPNLGGAKEVGFANFTVWVRHPADISFSTVHGGFAGSEYQGYVTYSLESPVAYFNPTGREKVVDADSILMCLSCHRAHASNYPDALRWDYANITTSDTRREGCLICHTTKGRQQ